MRARGMYARACGGGRAHGRDVLLGLMAVLLVAAQAALAASAARAAEPPVITSVSPEHAQFGVIENNEYPEITIVGENLQGATVTAPDFWRESGEQEFHVVEDTGTSLVVKAWFADQPGVRELHVHTPGGNATTSVTFLPYPGGDPVIGRCYRGGPEGGEYRDSKCLYKYLKSGIYPGGNYDWSAGLASPAVTFSGGEFKFIAYPQVTCTSVTGTGSLLNDREVDDVLLTFHGCEYLGAACSNTATAGDVETFPLLLSFGWWKKHFPRGRKKPAVGVFPKLVEGTIAQFQCGAHSLAFGGGWEAPVKAAKAKSSLPFAFGTTSEEETKGEENPLFHMQWYGWGAQVVPLMKLDGEDNGMAGPYGTLSMNAPEPFQINEEK